MEVKAPPTAQPCQSSYCGRLHFHKFSWPGFTLVELLVVMSILALLMGLLIPAVIYTRNTVRATRCANNLYQIGTAVQQYQSKRLRSPNLGAVLTGLGEYLDDERAVWICPQAGTGASGTLEKGLVSYGINMCVHRMLGSDSGKIIAIDANCDTLEYEGIDAKTWEQDVAPRHTGTVAVLYFDGHVEKGIRPGVFHPYDSARGEDNVLTYWRPMSGRCTPDLGGQCGLLAKYYPVTDWTGTPAERVDGTIHLPFGNNEFFHVPYNVPLTGATPASSWPLKSATWTGRLRADETGPYRFFLSCDNEAWLRIDGKEVIHRDTGGPEWVVQFQAAASPVSMTSSRWVDIEIRWREHHPGTPSHVWVKWQAPSMSGPTDIPTCNMRAGSVSTY